MIAFLAFDNIRGFSCRYLHRVEQFEADLMQLERLVPLANHEVALPAQSEGIYVVSRRSLRERWTWIGAYKPVPVHLQARVGDFFGVGIWLREKAMPGAQVCALLEGAIAPLESLMTAASNWSAVRVNLAAVNQDSENLHSISAWERPLADGQGLGFDRVEATSAFALDRDRNMDIERALDHAQTGFGLRSFSKLLIPLGERAAGSIKIPGPRLQVGASLQNIDSPDMPAAEPRAARGSSRPAQPAWDNAGALSREQRTEPSADLSRWVKRTDGRLEEMERSIAVAWKRTTIIAAGGAALSSICTVLAIGGLSLAGAFTPERRYDLPGETAMSGKAGDGKTSLPLGIAAGPDQYRAGPEDMRPANGGETAEYYSRLEANILALTSVVDPFGAIPSDDTRRRLQKQLANLVDTLQQSSDPRIRALSDKVRAQSAELVPRALDIRKPR